MNRTIDITLEATDAQIDVDGGIDSNNIVEVSIVSANADAQYSGDGNSLTVSLCASDSMDWEQIEGKPDFSDVATSGAYGDLVDLPNINNVQLQGEMSAEDLGLATAEQAIPPGGTTGYVLAKRSDEDNDVEWVEQTGGGSGNYEELDNLPSVNGVTLIGELETEDLNIEALTNEEIDQLLV